MMVIGTGVGLFRHFSGTRDRSKDVDKVANCSFVLSSPCLIVLLNSVHFAGSRPCQISAQKQSPQLTRGRSQYVCWYTTKWACDHFFF